MSRYRKSDEVPDSNDAPLKVLVGDNYEELIVNNSNDALIYIYHPKSRDVSE